MKIVTRIILVALLCAIAGAGCSKKNPVAAVEEVFNPDGLYQVYIMGVPMLRPDFATSGRFDLAVIGLTFNENVFWATGSNTTMTAYCSTGTYTATIEPPIAQRIPSLSQIAVQLIMDGSFSMTSSDPDFVRADAGKLFVRKLLRRNPLHRVAVAEFSNFNYWTTPDYYFHLGKDFADVSDTVGFDNAFAALTEGGTNTPLYTSIRRGIEHIDSVVPSAQYNRTVLAFTDGVNNAGYTADSIGAMITLSQARGIPVFMVGLGTGNQLDIPGMTRLASYSGGVFAQSTGSNELKGIFAVIATSLTQGYNVVTCTVKKSDGTVPLSGTNLKFSVRVKDGELLKAKDVWFKIP